MLDFDFGLGEDIDLLRESVHAFATDRIAPRATDIDEKNEFPRDLWPELGELGLLGITVAEEYGGSALGYLAHVVAMEEISRASASLGLSYGAHSNLCVNQLHRWGSDEQKARYLPKLVSGEHLGALAMSESGAGSDVMAMRTTAIKDGNEYVLNGSKMWITNAPHAHLAVIWAKVDGSDDIAAIRGFLVERGTPGFETPTMKHKMSLRASETGEIVLNDCRVPEANMLPGAKGLGAPLACLNQARFGIAFGVVGAARACYDAANAYARERIAFGVPIARKQLVQHRLVEMAEGIARAQTMVLHFARLKEKGELTPWQVSLSKRNNVAMALDVARSARAVLGANGISVEYPVIRHMLNLESVYTYEGTHEVHTLILGRALTGENGF